jgi:hypothetical protein
MTKEERIKELYALTAEIDDEDLKQELHELEAEYATEPEIDILDELTPEQYRQLMQADEDMENGLGIPWEEFRTSFNQWRTQFESTHKSKKK